MAPERNLVTWGTTSAVAFCEVWVRVGSSRSNTREARVFLKSVATMNGRGLFTTNFMMPCAMRRRVFSASGFFRSKIDGHGIDQSIISAEVRHGLSLPDRTSGLSGLPCVGDGH